MLLLPLGVVWGESGVPVEQYGYRVDDSIATDAFPPLTEDDFHLVELLRWFHHAHFEMTADEYVVFCEELIYIVQSDHLESPPPEVEGSDHCVFSFGAHSNHGVSAARRAEHG